ncbi:MAG: hypothetical protein ACI9X4_002799, partial [Glaciecola sp.]
MVRVAAPQQVGLHLSILSTISGETNAARADGSATYVEGGHLRLLDSFSVDACKRGPRYARWHRG